MKIALLVVTVLVMFVNWWSRWRGDDRVEQWAKPLATIGVVGLALVSGAPTAQIVVASIALTLCLGGDVALMPAIDKFVVGLASFLLGHLVFIILFIQYGLTEPALAGVAVILAGVLVATTGLTIVRAAAVQDRALQLPVLAYLLVISVMAVFGWATANPWVIAGSALFVLSDSLLGWRQFVRSHDWMAAAVMVTYHGAIASFALSLW